MEIVYSTGERSGPVSKHPTINTNEGPPGRRVTIEVNTILKPDSTYPLVFNPFKLSVSRAGEIEIDEAKFTIRNVSDEDLTINVISQPYGYFELSIPKSIKAGQAVDCKLKVKPEYLANPFEKSVTFELSDSSHTRFTLPVVRRLIGTGHPAPEKSEKK